MSEAEIKKQYEDLYRMHFNDISIDDMKWTKLISLRKRLCRECLHCRVNMTCILNDKYINVFPDFPFNECPDLVWSAVLSETDLNKELEILEDEFNK